MSGQGPRASFSLPTLLGRPAPGLSQTGSGTDTAKIVLIRQVIAATRAADQAVRQELTRDATLAGQKWGMRLGAEIGQELAAEGIQIQP